MTRTSRELQELKVRKGDNQPYAALLIAECCSEAELPDTIVTILDTVHASLSHGVVTPLQNDDGECEVSGDTTV